MVRYLWVGAVGAALLALAHGMAPHVAASEDSMLAALYEVAFGSPDLGPIDFETMSRRATPNDALACPPGFCPNAAADFDPGVFAGSDEVLRERFAAAALADGDAIPVYRSDAPGRPLQDRYVQRTRLMRFPDTIDVRFIALGDDTATLAIYSRSQIGSADMGVNLARIRRWTGQAMAGGADER